MGIRERTDEPGSVCCISVFKDLKAAGGLLPGVHRVISTSKTGHNVSLRIVSEKYLQVYLSEICYRFNRRFWERKLFDQRIRAYALPRIIAYSILIKIDNTIIK
jgi:hypothetical protein